jgi:hypothetical protein
LALLLGLALVPACVSPDSGGPDLDLEKYFVGDLVAHGRYSEFFGGKNRSFRNDATGVWDGETLRLVERFTFDDGSSAEREWRLTKTGADTWRGTVSGIVGTASGKESGNSFQLSYLIDLPLPEGTRRVRFVHHMWRTDANRVWSRIAVSQLGIPVGTVQMEFQRLGRGAGTGSEPEPPSG